MGNPVLVIELKTGRGQVIVYTGGIGVDGIREQKVGIYRRVEAAGAGVVVFNPVECAVILQKIIDAG